MRYFYLLFVLACVGVVGVAGFRGDKSRKPFIELFPDMVRQGKLRPQNPNDFFPDQMSSQAYPAGTVPRTRPMEFNRQVVLIDGKPVYGYEDAPINTGKVTGTTNWVETNPMPITRELLDRGQQRYQINCLPCHGPAGDGKGITSKYGMIGMANFHDQRLITMADGEIFNTISNGKNLMGPYGANVAVVDRWAIIAYVRALQRSQLSIPDEVPEQYRAALQK